MILDKLLWCCVADSKRNQVKELIQNEEYHYVEPRHKAEFIDTMWEIGQAIRECRYIEVDYLRTKDKSVVRRKLKPAAIMFSEYYFYLTAFIDDNLKVEKYILKRSRYSNADFFEIQGIAGGNFGIPSAVVEFC